MKTQILVHPDGLYSFKEGVTLPERPTFNVNDFGQWLDQLRDLATPIHPDSEERVKELLPKDAWGRSGNDPKFNPEKGIHHIEAEFETVWRARRFNGEWVNMGTPPADWAQNDPTVCREVLRLVEKKDKPTDMSNEKHTLQEVVDFLCGKSSLENLFWGDDHIGQTGKYWWRKHLRESSAALLRENEKLKASIRTMERLRIEDAGSAISEANRLREEISQLKKRLAELEKDALNKARI